MDEKKYILYRDFRIEEFEHLPEVGEDAYICLIRQEFIQGIAPIKPPLSIYTFLNMDLKKIELKSNSWHLISAQEVRRGKIHLLKYYTSSPNGQLKGRYFTDKSGNKWQTANDVSRIPLLIKDFFTQPEGAPKKEKLNNEIDIDSMAREWLGDSIVDDIRLNAKSFHEKYYGGDGYSGEEYDDSAMNDLAQDEIRAMNDETDGFWNID